MRHLLFFVGFCLILGSDAWAQQRPTSYADFNTSVAPNGGAALTALIAGNAVNFIYLQCGTYELTNPVVINRTSTLYIHGIDRMCVILKGHSPSQPLFSVTAGTVIQFAGVYLWPTANAPKTTMSRAILATNTAPITFEMMDSFVASSTVEFDGPGTAIIQSSTLDSSGYTDAEVVVNNDGMDAFVFGGDWGWGNPGTAGSSDYARVWQKHGCVRVHSLATEGTIGIAAYRIETACPRGPHYLANNRTEGNDGARIGLDVSRLIYVPPTTDKVDIVVKANAMESTAGPATTSWDNCVLANYNGAGTLWLIGNLMRICGEHLVEGTASPGAKVVSIGNMLTGTTPFTVTGATIVSAEDEYYRFVGTTSVWGAGNVTTTASFVGSPTNTFTRSSGSWISDGCTNTAVCSAISISGAVNAGNNGNFNVTAITPATLTLVPYSGQTNMVTESGTAGVNALFFVYTADGNTTAPYIYWVPNGPGAATPTIASYGAVPQPPMEILPGFLTRPPMTTALPGMVNVKDYGAVGDGTTDDFAHIQAAFDSLCAGASRYTHVYFPVGSYRLSSGPIYGYAPGHSCGSTGAWVGGWIAGAGSANTQIVMDPGVKNGTLFLGGFGYATLQGITFKTWPWSVPVVQHNIAYTSGSTAASINASFDNGTTADIAIGMYVSGTNDPAGTTVASIVDAHNFTLAAAPTTTCTGGCYNVSYFSADPQLSNFDLEGGTGNVQQNTFYDVVFDGGWAGWAAGTMRFNGIVGQNSSEIAYGATFKNAHFGYVGGHQNVILNGTVNSTFANNDIDVGSWAATPLVSPGQSYVVSYNDTSTGARTSGGMGSYNYNLQSNAPLFLSAGWTGNPVLGFFDRSNLTPQGTASAFTNGGAMGPIFLDSTVTRSALNIVGGGGQAYALKLASTVADWSSAITNPPAYGVTDAISANTIGIDAQVSKNGRGTLTTGTFSTTTNSDLLVAFVAYDGPNQPVQTATVSGAGLSWQLVQRSNAQLGTAEIWTAQATSALTSVTVSSQPGTSLPGGTHGSLTVIAFTNASNVRVVGQANAPSGAPDISLPGVAAGNWVFAVGNDYNHAIARTPVSGQVLVHQDLDTHADDTYWVQSTAAPSTVDGSVDIHDSSPTTDQWNYAAIEILATW